MGACCSTPIADGEAGSKAVEDDATGGLADMYEVKHLLGSGSAGDTWLCRDRSTGELLAVKLMRRPIPRVMGTNIMREVKIGAQLGKGHLNIVKPKELILTRTHLGLVMEYVAGGNMADYILKTILLKFGSFDTRDGLVMEEDEARYFFTQIINAVDYCHRNKVAHRDLKMDNTLLDDRDPPRIKLCDFGFAKWWVQEPNMCTITGTPDYMAPQLLGAKANNKQQALYDGTKADIWAAGVMLCVMLIGRFPFEGIEMSNATNLEEVSAHVWRQQNSQRWYDNPLIAQDCSMLSADCVDLLNKMFDLDEARRISIPDIRQHPWFMKPLPPPYSQAMTDMVAEQNKVDQQVASGAFVSQDRDAALKRMIYMASTRYSPEQDMMTPEAAAIAGSEDLSRISASMLLRKISLTSIKPYQYDAADAHPDMDTISNFFRVNGATDDISSQGTSNRQPDGQQLQQQQSQPDQQQQQQLLPPVQLQQPPDHLQQQWEVQHLQQQPADRQHLQQQQQQPQTGLQPPIAQQQQQQHSRAQQPTNSSTVSSSSLGQHEPLQHRAAPAGSSNSSSPTALSQPPGGRIELTAAAAAFGGPGGAQGQPVSIGEIQVT